LYLDKQGYAMLTKEYEDKCIFVIIEKDEKHYLQLISESPYILKCMNLSYYNAIEINGPYCKEIELQDELSFKGYPKITLKNNYLYTDRVFKKIRQ
jgi:hypothetical protein